VPFCQGPWTFSKPSFPRQTGTFVHPSPDTPPRS
jgi:hypothetical protein